MQTLQADIEDAIFTFTVKGQCSEQSLVAFLCGCLPYPTEARLKEILLLGDLTIDQAVVRQNVQIKEGQVIQYCYRDYQEAAVCKDWKVLWQNSELVAIHKPAHLPVNRTTRNVYNTLIQLLRRESGWPEAHLLHRLDLETSGILLVAKSKAGAVKWQRQLPNLIIRKVYHAIVQGIPNWTEKHVDLPLAEKHGSGIRSQMHVVPVGEEALYKVGKPSQTHFKVLKKGKGCSLVECELFSGRKHQIRAHLSHLSHPIVGDKIYAHDGHFYMKRLSQPLDEHDYAQLKSRHHLLHAYSITLAIAGKTLELRDEHYSNEWHDLSQQHHLAP